MHEGEIPPTLACEILPFVARRLLPIVMPGAPPAGFSALGGLYTLPKKCRARFFAVMM